MDNVLSYLLNYALDHGIGCTLTHELPSHFPSVSFPESNEVLINMNWHNKWEVPFSFAHELGHILNGDDGVRYYESFPTRSKTEYQANLTGIRIMLKYSRANDFNVSNPVKFVEVFGIPTYLETAVAYELNSCKEGRYI